MALIDLKKLNKLKIEATKYKRLTDIKSFNYSNESALNNDVFVYYIKAYNQIEHLCLKVDLLYTICRDIESGKYRKDYEMVSHLSEEYNPVQDLKQLINKGSVFDLPSTIEQYKELFAMVQTFSHLRESSRKRFEMLGFTIAQSDLLYQQQINDIEVEYCLDGYNEFYTKVDQLITQGENIEYIAQEILGMVKKEVG